MKLSVCPFSVVVFFATAAFITIHFKEQKRRKKEEEKQERRRKKSSSSNNSGESTTITIDYDSIELPICDVVFVLGAPGVGKGTQCQLVADHRANQWVHLSAGDLLRLERAKTNSKLANEINHCIASGKLVTSEVTCQLIENAMKEIYATQKITKFLIDGFPRSFGNATAWNENPNMNKHTIQFVIDFICPEEILVARLLHRGKTSGRVDDNISTIKKRFDGFVQETTPILDYYRNSTTIPVHTIRTDQAVSDVYKQVEQLFFSTTTTTTT